MQGCLPSGRSMPKPWGSGCRYSLTVLNPLGVTIQWQMPHIFLQDLVLGLATRHVKLWGKKQEQLEKKVERPPNEKSSRNSSALSLSALVSQSTGLSQLTLPETMKGQNVFE